MDSQPAALACGADGDCRNSATGAAISDSEKLRTRELARYFASAGVVPFSTPEPVSPSLPSDATLTALASIGPLRLNCDRSFVSLIDSHNQYIIAEGTRTLSSRQPGRHGGEDGLYLGVQALDKVWGVCPNTIHAFTDTTGKSKVNTLNVVADTSKYYIRDFQADPTFVHRPFVTSWPHMRSYLEVPLRSPSGFVIGSYCVVDNKVREDFDDDAVFILDEVATSIMEHLDLVKARIFCDRAGRLMKGLGVFIQKDSADQSDARVQDSLLAKGSSRKGSAGSYLEASTTRTTTGSNDERCKAGQTPPSTPSPGTEKNPFVTATLEPRVGTTEEAPAVHSVSEADASTTENAKMQPDISTEVARTFSRAGVLIRDALDVEGVVFIDAYSAGIGAEGGSSQFGVSSAKEFDFLRSDTSLSAHSRTAEPLCTMLSSSTKHSVDVAQHMLERGVPESLLRRLMAEYPSGQVFTDEAMGTFLGNGNHSNQYLGAAQSADARKLFDLFPQAKCLMFLPLWDFNKNRFFAATFTFSNDPTRFFNMDDVTYLSAFGNSIMTEISRIEAVATSNAKSDFISSISHELRSPLHGILASSELLRETMTDARQLSIVGMIDICGNNLLDTMNHLLDYAKINNLTRVGKRRKRPPKGDQDHVESVSLVDLNQLVHDVVEGTHRGQTATLGSRDDTSSARGSSGAKAGDVLVTLDIEARDWCMEISVGAWKRILMNIFSNALKYTDNGLVEVKLQMAESSDNGQKMISLSVKDTGRGIGDAYLKHHLFEPFTQEDNLSSGTGLGLSIVQQIVRNLEGRINVQSEKGVGTRIEVLLPAPNSSQCGPIAEVPQVADHLHGSVPSVESYRGRTICLVGFDVLPDLSEPPSGILSAEVQRLIYCKAWITQVAREWLGMEIVAAAALQSMGADVYIAESSSVSSTFDDPHGRPLTLKLGLRPNPEFNADFVPGSDFDPKAVIVNQPLTPRKLALALLECFQLHSNPSAIDGDSNNTDLPLRAQESSILSLVKDLHITDSMESVVTSRVSERHPQVLVQNAVSLQSADGKVDAVSIMSFPSTIAEHHVLLVDDNIINLRILTTYIQKLGCSYAAASDGLEALNVFKSTSRPFSYVFMDISMPIMDGLESTRHIREFERERALSGPKACIVALTGLGSSASQKEAANSGMDMFLTKPVQLKNIKKLLGGDHSMLAG